MSRYELTPQARRDMYDIGEYVGTDNPAASARLIDRFEAAFRILADAPGLGHVRADIVPYASGLRFWTVGSYLVIYRPAAHGINVIRVLSGFRDIGAVLSRSE